MTESEDLELYYITSFKTEGMPDFSELDEQYKERIKNTLGFALFRLNKSGERIMDYLKDELKKFAKKL